MPLRIKGVTFALLASLSGCVTASSEFLDISKMNASINALGYRDDSVQFGVNDHWQSPREFKDNGFGDCEDYAIAKFFALEGMGKQQIYLHYAMTPQGAHMVVSYLDERGDRFALDNRNSEHRPFSDLGDLDIVWSFDRIGVWMGALPNGKIYPMNIQKFKRILKGDGSYSAL